MVDSHAVRSAGHGSGPVPETAEREKNEHEPYGAAYACRNTDNDNGFPQQPLEGNEEIGMFPESPADADTVSQEDVPPDGGNGEERSAEKSGNEEGSGTEETDAGHGGTSEPESKTEAEPETETGGGTSEQETESETGGGTSEQETESETLTEAGVYMEAAFAETETGVQVLHDDLTQIHEDLQTACCFIIVFLVILLCQYVYRFFRIFF